MAAASAAAVMPSGVDRSKGCVPNFFEEVVPSFSISTFRSHFRMSPSSLEVYTIMMLITVVFVIQWHELIVLVGRVKEGVPKYRIDAFYNLLLYLRFF